ncbi:RNA-binding ATPase activator ESF2 NDAI_0K02750 [Naumovozyma dairenensis CBS 421]|uniref:Pre-rRNA-processing protein ESF2 n=1 Tax=Naumovozyma dairenensis (strain ATCC 10597 / BCRC 20456 / CBS 421 / NBRC 0211 / NRRL Y-12639) TaxID=1071378 RepID=G0WI55_NAUDC|nr:hypothetical protein NDAI_0K02750 [Naumovozyma dairenensis CBS 421]CCD27466.1 hypothetical protein NDAI_0K02750 [Naumovozyma dairenensis CBS 421]
MSKEESDIDDFNSSDDEDANINHTVLISSKKKTSITSTTATITGDVFTKEDESDFEDESQDGDDEEVELVQKDAEAATATADEVPIEEDTIDKEEEEEDNDVEKRTVEEKRKSLKERLSKLKNNKKLNHKTGVVYLSKIPPYMKPAKMRQILSRFGEIDRLFLKKENDQKYTRRIKGGGNKKTMYEEGWAEFIRKRDAKLCAETLNGNIIGGKKGTFYHDDILNVKYLPGFKWADLTEQIARENDVRQAKLELEISQANKLNAEYIRNVEQSKMLNNIEKSKKRQGKDIESSTNNNNNSNIREFKQRRVNTNRADAPESHKQGSGNNGSVSKKDIGSILNNLL